MDALSMIENRLTSEPIASTVGGKLRRRGFPTWTTAVFEPFGSATFVWRRTIPEPPRPPWPKTPPSPLLAYPGCWSLSTVPDPPPPPPVYGNACCDPPIPIYP